MPLILPIRGTRRCRLVGSGPTWLIQFISLVTKIGLPHANAEYLEQMQPNVEVTLYYNDYGMDGIRVPGLTIKNNSDRGVLLNDVRVEGVGFRDVLLPVDSQARGTILYVPPVAPPGELSVFPLQGNQSCKALCPYMTTTVRLSEGERIYLRSWKILSGGESEAVP